ncbi:MAG: hypothetical protein HUU21_19675 [Polyangiaceae bacterium]|nr:hypothetical protein [Polyangiaceae bacterium]NUQ75769.1 hypothetical protein [Polyangiaceae bacterium]
MSSTSSSAGYLDAIFGAIRTYAHELAEGRAWLLRAREVGGAAWRFELLSAARGSLDRAGASLWEVEERLQGLGDPEEIPAPLDQLARNVPGMRAELDAESDALAALEVEMMERPIGQG